MFLETALAADTRVKVLRTLFQEDLPQLDAAALAKETGKSRAGVHKALVELLPSRVLLPLQRGRTTYYAVNPDHASFDPLLGLFRGERSRYNVPHLFPTYWNHLEPVVARLAAMRSIRAVLLFGSMTRPPVYPTADVDLLVVMATPGRAPRVESSVLGHPVSVLALGEQALAEKAAQRDPFVSSALERHVVLWQDYDYEFPWSRRAPGPSKATSRRRGAV